MTRGGTGPVLTLAVAGWTGSPVFGSSTGTVSRDGTMPVSGGADVEDEEEKVALSGAVLERLLAPLTGGAAGRGDCGVGRTSGSVLAREVEPVREADCLSCVCVGETRPVGGRIVFCIGCVTAVDQAGGILPEPEGVETVPELLIGNVAAPEPGRGPIWVESGFSGRGGSVTRSVSRRCGFGSAEVEASSAIIKPFYIYSEKCSMAKLVIMTVFHIFFQSDSSTFRVKAKKRAVKPVESRRRQAQKLQQAVQVGGGKVVDLDLARLGPAGNFHARAEVLLQALLQIVEGHVARDG